MIFPVPAEDYFSKVATSAILDPSCFEGNYLFDTDGNKWTYQLVSDEFKNTLLNRILANTFDNRLHDAKVIWTLVGSYSLSELQERIIYCIENDDDVLTQFEDAQVIIGEIDKAPTFDSIMQILDKYIFDVNEEPLLNQEPES